MQIVTSWLVVTLKPKIRIVLSQEFVLICVLRQILQWNLWTAKNFPLTHIYIYIYIYIYIFSPFIIFYLDFIPFILGSIQILPKNSKSWFCISLNFTISFFITILFPLAQQLSLGQDLLIHEVPRSHTTTHNSRQDSSGRGTSSSQRPLNDNIKTFTTDRHPFLWWDSNP